MSIFDLTQLSDDDLRAALFDTLAERIDARAHEDPSIALVNRMPTVLTVSRRGNLLTLSQGIGPGLLRGDLKWKDRREKLRIFNVGRATIQSRLAITPDRIEGTPDEILDWILAMFLESTAIGEESRPAVAEATHENRPTPLPAAPQPAPRPALQETQPAPRSARQESRRTPRVPQDRPTIREALQEQPPAAAGSTQSRRPAAQRTIRDSQPAPFEVTEESPPGSQMADKPSEAEVAPRRPAPIREMTRPTLRTFQLLLETAQRELHQAKTQPADSRYFLISAGVFVALTAEAFLNDLGSRVIPSWSQLQRLDPREKAEVLNIELFNEKVDWSVRPFQSVAAALGFRRALAHAYAETLSFDAPVRTADRKENEVPRTRRTPWQEHCDVATIQQWIIDVLLLIELFSGAHDRS
jgi:hypothetical protein